LLRKLSSSCRCRLRKGRVRLEPRPDDEAPCSDGAVVCALAEDHTPHLLDGEAAALGPILGNFLAEVDDAMDERLELEVVGLVGRYIQQQHGASARGEVVLQPEDLAPVSQGVAGQQPHIRERVEDDPARLQLIHGGHDGLRRGAQLDIRGVEERVVRVRLEGLLLGLQIADGDPLQGPPVRLRHRVQLRLRLREGDVQARLPLAYTREEELQGEGRLARPGLPLDKVRTVGGQTPTQNGVEARDTRGDSLIPGCHESSGSGGGCPGGEDR
jgi:hypothetical protein